LKTDLAEDGIHFNADGNNKVFSGILNIIDKDYPEIHPINANLPK